MKVGERFTSLESASAADWAAIISAEENARQQNAGLGLLRLLEMQADDDSQGWPINVYQHSLQAATRALRAGEDDMTVFCALFHDVSQTVTPFNHGLGAARLLEPYVSPEHVWMLEHHAMFQSRHALHHPTRDQTAYLRHRGHPAFDRTIAFCSSYDETSFDPEYDSLPLSEFYDLVDRVCRPASELQLRARAGPMALWPEPNKTES